MKDIYGNTKSFSEKEKNAEDAMKRSFDAVSITNPTCKNYVVLKLYRVIMTSWRGVDVYGYRKNEDDTKLWPSPRMKVHLY